MFTKGILTWTKSKITMVVRVRRYFVSIPRSRDSFTPDDVNITTKLLKEYSRRVLLIPSKEGQSDPSTSEDPYDSLTSTSSTQEIANQLVYYWGHGRPTTSTSLESLTPQQEQVLNHLALQLGPENPTRHDLETAMTFYPEQEEHKSIPFETILQRRIRPMCRPKYELIFSSLLTHVGMQFIVQLRQDLLQYIPQQKDQNSFLFFRLQQMNQDMKLMLSAWFSAGLLELRRITYETTAASIIEIIAKKESVHPIRDLQDLRFRLSNENRRCFAFFHPTLPNKPLVFVHVALSHTMPQTMEELDSPTSSPTTSKAAIFYSINNTHKGLSGVDLGTFLIKRVVEVLKQEFASLEIFSTLSPLPNFRMWFKRKVLRSSCSPRNSICLEELDEGAPSSSIVLSSEEILSLSHVLNGTSTSSATSSETHYTDTIRKLFTTLETTKWYEEPLLVETFRPILMKYAAIYLAVEKEERKKQTPLDGVAKFHIRNGAEMYRLNFLADKSRTGMHNSFGIMVNYNYNYSNIEMNHMLYEINGRIPVMEGVSKWLK